MAKKILKATHAGEIKIGNTIIPCAVLEDGTRLLTQQGFLKAIGRSGQPAKGRGSQLEKMAPFLDINNIRPYVDNELADSSNTVLFSPSTGSRAYGYKAELLPKVCEIYLKARDDKKLFKSQMNMAKACDILTRGLAHIGIIALVDEATGYQYDRDRNELNRILEVYIAKELLPWTRQFPNEFYRQLFRLRGWQYSPVSVKRPQYIGKLTNELIYDKLPPGVLNELRIKNPRTPKGYRKHRFHQFLTEDIGHPHLGKQLAAVITLMKVSPNWRRFYEMFKRAFPKSGEQLFLDLTESDEDQ